MKVNNFDRLFAAVATPYHPGTYDVDEEALRKLLRQFLQPKVMQTSGGIVINPENPARARCGTAPLPSRK